MTKYDYNENQTTPPNYLQRLDEICDDYRTRFGVGDDPLLQELWGLSYKFDDDCDFQSSEEVQ
jgi:hypothetical protein